MFSHLWNAVRGLFVIGRDAEPSPRRLAAETENQLISSLRSLRAGESGWISYDDFARLYSSDGQTPPSEFEEDGKRALAQAAVGYSIANAPEQRRIYFTPCP